MTARQLIARDTVLPSIAAAYLSGNLASQSLSALPSLGWIWLLAILGAAAIYSRRLRIAGFALLGFCWAVFIAARGLEQRLPQLASAQDVELRGWIDSFPDINDERTTFSLRLAGQNENEMPKRVRLSWYDAPTLAAGSSLTVVARLRGPRGVANPRSFDYEKWLFLEGYGATGYVRSGRVDTDQTFGVAQRWLRFRARIAKRIEGNVDNADAAALLIALSLGERGGFTDQNWNTLRRTGTSHLVAISGMHIGLIAAMAFFVFLRLALRLHYLIARNAWVWAAVLAFIPAALYAALAGFGLPTQRALMMIGVAQAIIIARKRVSASCGFAIALLVVLTLDPLATLQASFWLSFGAVGLLLLYARHLQKRVGGKAWLACARRVHGFGRVQWAMTLGLVPLLAVFFGEIALLSMPINLIAIPFFSFVMVPLTLASAASAAVGSSGLGIVGLGATLAQFTWQVLNKLSELPYAAISLPRPSLLVGLVAVAAVVLASVCRSLPGHRLALFGLLPLFFNSSNKLPLGTAEVTVLDVGHGLAVLIETSNHLVLYDTGPLSRSGFDAGARIVVPVIRGLRRPAPDLVVVSHGDSDHAGGAVAISREYPGARWLLGPDIDRLAGDLCAAGQAWVWDDVSFSILHPGADFYQRGNESSCVLKVETANRTLVATGDIESHAELLLARDSRVQADVVVVPHHGSATSSSAEFVRAVAPSIAIVSAAFNNRWGFPKPEVRERWQRAGATVLVTGDHGAIQVTLGGERLGIRAQRAGRKRYWQAESPPFPGAQRGGTL